MPGATRARGPGPVRFLAPRIEAVFASARASSYAWQARAVADGLVQPAIAWIVDPGPVRTPYADCDARQIVLHDSFLSYLWALCYSLLVLEEHARCESLRDGGSAISGPAPARLAEAAKLFHWAMRQRVAAEEWPTGAPKPEHESAALLASGAVESGSSAYYAKAANMLFTYATVYVIAHEYVHLVHGHCDIVQVARQAGAGSEQWQVLRLLEREADVAAREALLEPDAGVAELRMRGLGIVIAHCASLLLAGSPSQLIQWPHPDLDDRLLAALQALQPEAVGPLDVLWTMACQACARFLGYHGVDIDSSPAESGRELLERYLRRFDEVKGANA